MNENGLDLASLVPINETVGQSGVGRKQQSKGEGQSAYLLPKRVAVGRSPSGQPQHQQSESWHFASAVISNP